MGSCTESTGSDLNTDLLPVKVGEKWGYVNPQGEYIINPQFDFADPFTDGRALVKVNGKFGYIDEKGSYAVNPKYKSATIFSEDRAWVVGEGSAPTLIDRDGKELFDMKDVEFVSPYYDGLAKVEVIGENGKLLYGFINKKGEYVVNPIYEYAGNFSDGMAAISGEGKEGYINTSGKIIINDTTFSREGSFYDGHAFVGIREKDYSLTYGVIDRTGKYLINPQFKDIGCDGKGFIVENNDHQWGWCDSDGKFIINPQFDGFLHFGKSDMAPVAIGEKWGYADRRGKLVINPQFDKALPFVDNKFALVKTGERFGFIDREGKYIANPQFSDFGISFYGIYLYGSQYIAGHVKSDYFDAEGAVDLIVRNVNEKGVHQLVPGVSIDKVLKKVGADESELRKNSYESLHELYSRSLGPNMDVRLNVGGEFFNTVSDGWWGYERVFNPKAKVRYFHYIIELKDRGTGKGDQLMKALRRRFNVKGDGIQGRIGKCDVDLIEMENGVDILVYKESEKGDITASTHEDSQDSIITAGNVVPTDTLNVDISYVTGS